MARSHSLRHEPTPLGDAKAYTMRRRLLRLGDSFEVRDATGKPVLDVAQRLFRVRTTFSLRTTNGRETLRVRRRLFRFRQTMAVERGGRVVAVVRRHRWNPVVERFDVEIPNARGLVSFGSRVSPSYRLERGGSPVADVVKAVPSLRDTYSVDVGRKENQTLMLAVALGINELSHAREPGSSQWVRALVWHAFAWRGAAGLAKVLAGRRRATTIGSRVRSPGSGASSPRTPPA